MAKKYRYILASNKVPKLDCPYCGAKKHWQRYIDTKTGEVLPDVYGRCDNANKCGKWISPYKDGYAKKIWKQEQEQGQYKKYPKQTKPIKETPISFIPDKELKLTLTGYEKNVFIQNLLTRVAFPFKKIDVERVISLYYLGTITSGYRTGAITFPFIDKNNNIRAIQVKQFNKSNHTTSTDFLHSIIEKQYIRHNKPLPEWLKAYNKNDKKVSCLFGEHLLKTYPHNPVALTEAPKTAIYGTLYFGFPEQDTNFIWLAVYNKSSFSFDKLKVLQGRDVVVFPDLSKDGSTFKEWEQKAKDYEMRLPGTKFLFSNLLEYLAPDKDRIGGNDIADYLIKQDWRLFRKQNNSNEIPEEREVKQTEKQEQNNKTVKPATISYQTEPVDDKDLAMEPEEISFSSIDLGTDYRNYLIKKRIFNDSAGRLIEIVGTKDNGRCGKPYHNRKKICIGCLLNCSHILKIDGKLQNREYTQIEVLKLQYESEKLKEKQNTPTIKQISIQIPTAV
ncbi:DUF6371 domain-containing protein [Candidatus Sulfidibacterium hydrothermale]|uniref:DUF6371 domain-containing protein n=1 Tax=Candidatus Sulfidibacterium hydrothermale TaxID=2875962 RepID=UPI001F0A14B9|nr:DUF6371 domain-containing protein [Candidatus Sulfidibacterium hydrothermale]UBM62781.1 DUF6371 domain-containing protein [Candidatus Sulfidibacterium hydrothermale]